jgi:hypothetical protein
MKAILLLLQQGSGEIVNSLQIEISMEPINN